MEYAGTRVALGRKAPRASVVVEDRKLLGLLPERVTDVSLQFRESSTRMVGGLAVLGDDKDGIPGLVDDIGVSEAFGRHTTLKPE